MDTKNTKKKQIILFSITIVYIGFIFYNSLQTAELSSARSMTLLENLHRWIPQTGFVSEHMVRKAAHFSEFMLLGILLNADFFYCVGIDAGRMYALKRAIPITCLCGMLIAQTDETIQLFVEGRSGQVTDVWIDFFGVCAGVFIYNCSKWRKG